jgi:hypothetical protein
MCELMPPNTKKEKQEVYTVKGFLEVFQDRLSKAQNALLKSIEDNNSISLYCLEFDARLSSPCRSHSPSKAVFRSSCDDGIEITIRY